MYIKIKPTTITLSNIFQKTSELIVHPKITLNVYLSFLENPDIKECGMFGICVHCVFPF